MRAVRSKRAVGASRWRFARPLSSTIAVAILAIAPAKVVLSAEGVPAAVVACAVFHDWKDHIPFWPDTKIHARQGAIPPGDQFQHVQSSFWEVAGNGEEDHDDMSTPENGDAFLEGDVPSFHASFAAASARFHTDWVGGYAINHETTACLGPPEH